jgi:hypothetical protein
MAVSGTVARVSVEEAAGCLGCRYFWVSGTRGDAVAAQVAAEHGHPLRRGKCRRYPVEVAKDEDDWCGEHEARAEGRSGPPRGRR